MQPVEITAVDRLLTALVQARSRGQLQAGEPVVDCLPSHPWDNHVFAAQNSDGTLTPLKTFAFNEHLAGDYRKVLRRKGFPLREVYGSPITSPR